MSIFFGRNVEADTREVQTIGKTELNMRPMRTKIYIVVDNLNQLSNQVIKALQESDERNAILDNIKDIKRLVNSL